MTSRDAAPPRDFEALKGLLVARRPDLAPRLVQVAEYALGHPDEIAFGTVASIAAAADVQPSTLVRFAQALGYAGFSDLQDVFRAQIKARWPDYRDRLDQLKAARRDGSGDDGAHLLAGFTESGLVSIERLQHTVVAADIDRAAEMIAAARTIYLLGLRRAFPITAYLAYGLGKLGLRAALVDNVAALAPEQIAGAGPEDVLIAISFTPYTPATIDLSEKAAARRMPIVAITDSAFSPLAPHAAVKFEVVEADFAGFRSLSASFCLAAALAVAVGARTSRQG
jgi:DNA-binding MurR/RpiR family transcriptional regulator